MAHRVLVTGGAGYIGSTLVEYLLQDESATVLVVDNFCYGQQPLLHLASNRRLRIMRGDAANGDLMRRIVSGYAPTVVVPLAALVGAPLCQQNKQLAWNTNYHAVVQLVKLLPGNIPVIFPNTNSGYGHVPGKKECTEGDELHPLTEYAKSKIMAETVLRKHHENFVSLRLATVFGSSPRMRFDLLVNDFVRRAVLDHSIVVFEGHARRNFVHVRDVSRAIIHCIAGLMKTVPPGVYNVGNPDLNMTKLHLAELVSDQLGGCTVFADRVQSDPDKRDYVVSNEKIMKTGFQFEYGLISGIQEVAKIVDMFPRGVSGNV